MLLTPSLLEAEVVAKEAVEDRNLEISLANSSKSEIHSVMTMFRRSLKWIPFLTKMAEMRSQKEVLVEVEEEVAEIEEVLTKT